jgi:isopenicillin-N N-acyltransferase-like protein
MAGQIAEKFLPTLEKHAPSAIEEMQGIAAGAGVSFNDILILNCRSEIGLTGGMVDGCSALAFKHPETGKQILAQNWDWFKEQLNNVIVLDIRHLD